MIEMEKRAGGAWAKRLLSQATALELKVTRTPQIAERHNLFLTQAPGSSWHEYAYHAIAHTRYHTYSLSSP